MEIRHRKVTTLNEEEVTKLIKKLFKPDKIDRIVYNLKQNIITAYLYIDCKNDSASKPVRDAIVISADGLVSPTGFSFTEEQTKTMIQFLAAKGCLSVFKANPFMKKIKRELPPVEALAVEFTDITGHHVEYNAKKNTIEVCNLFYEGENDLDCAKYLQAMINGVLLNTCGGV